MRGFEGRWTEERPNSKPNKTKCRVQRRYILKKMDLTFLHTSNCEENGFDLPTYIEF